jgi:hypothetical protein
MPIELHHEHDGVYRLDITGRLGRTEYGACEAQLAQALRQRESIKLLCVLRAFEGWDRHEGWNDNGFYFTHGDAITRIAIVGDEYWRDELMMFAAADLRRAPVQYFPESNLAQAREWLSASVPNRERA